MKNTVDETILSLSEDELKQFRYFITRKGHAAGREDVLLIDKIRKGGETKSSNASLQVKKRIKKQLEQFASFDNIRHHSTSELHSMVEMARFLFRKNLYSHAWDYLHKAEQFAVSKEEYQLLGFIYEVQISYLSTMYIPDSHSPDISLLLDKREKNLSLAKTNGDINAAYSLLMHKIREVSCKELNADIDQLVNDILNRYGLYENVYESPKTYARTVNIVCRSLREKKDYQAMKQYAMQSYRKMEERAVLPAINMSSLMELVKSVIYSTLRTRDYSNCEVFLKINAQNIEQLKLQKEEYMSHDFLNDIAAFDLYLCTNRLEEARSIMLPLYKKHMEDTESAMIFFTLRINIMALYFKCREYDQAIRIYNELLQHNQDKFLKIGGLELVLFTEIYGVICYFETNDVDYAHYLLGKVRRKYADALGKSASSMENYFIRILDKLISDPAYKESKRFKADHAKFISLKEYIPADKEYISLNAWLTSKLTGQSYYECFTRLVQGEAVASPGRAPR